MRKIIIVKFVLTCLCLSGCQIIGGVNKRQNDDSAILTAKEIRTAQKKFETQNGKGKFGSLEQLAQSKLVSSELSDGEKDGYKFTLTVSENKYVLKAIPVDYGTEQSQGNFTLYLDESGIIRSAGKKGIDLPKWEIANSESIPLASQ